MNAKVADWMSTPPITVAPTATLSAAQWLMEWRKIRRLPVVDNGNLVGMLTASELRAVQPLEATLNHYEWRALLDRVTVAECMTTHPITIAPDASVIDAARLMLNCKVDALPVVEQDRLVGIITESDLFRLLITQHVPESELQSDRVTIVCHRCGTELRGRTLETIGPDDQCWRCHFHLHRCENCRYYSGTGCMLGRAERMDPIPGRTCPQYSYLVKQANEIGR